MLKSKAKFKFQVCLDRQTSLFLIFENFSVVVRRQVGKKYERRPEVGYAAVRRFQLVFDEVPLHSILQGRKHGNRQPQHNVSSRHPSACGPSYEFSANPKRTSASPAAAPMRRSLVATSILCRIVCEHGIVHTNISIILFPLITSPQGDSINAM